MAQIWLEPLSPPFQHVDGHCYKARLHRRHERVLRDAPAISIYADGWQIGVRSDEKGAVARIGYGLFSVDRTGQDLAVYFSELDNSNPNVNGRNYSIGWNNSESTENFWALASISLLEFQKLIIPFIAYVIEKQSIEENYYGSRIKQNYIFSGYDRAVIRYTVEHFSAKCTAVVEVGAGIGQIPIYLALCGFSAIGTEIAPMRIRQAAFLRAIVNRLYPSLGLNYAIVYGEFPAVRLPISAGKTNIAIFSNLGIGHPEEFSDRAIEGLVSVDYVIIDMHRFFRARDADEQLLLQQKIERRFDTIGIEIEANADFRAMIFKINRFPQSRSRAGQAHPQPK